MAEWSPDVDAILEMRGITKTFPGVKALSNVNLAVKRGEIHAVVGENGAGKSTLINLLSGAFAPDDGDIEVDGDAVGHLTPPAARNAGVAVVQQELSLTAQLSIAENIAAIRERIARAASRAGSTRRCAQPTAGSPGRPRARCRCPRRR